MDIAGLADARSWVNPRKARGWILLALLLYTVSGFVVLPWLIETQLPAQSQALLKRTATVDDVEFNPFSLRLRAHGFRLADDNDELLAEAQQLHANLQLRSLFRFALVFGDLELLQPRVYITRYAFADSNIGRLINDLDAGTAPDSTAASDDMQNNDAEGGLLRAIVDSLVIADGMVIFDDRALDAPFVTELGPVNISVNDFSTLPEASGEQQVSIRAETGAQLEWTGNLSVNPLKSAGRLTVSGSPLPVIHRYLRQQLQFDLDNCCLDIALDYELAATPDGGIRAAVDDLNLSLRNVAINADNQAGEVLSLPELTIVDGSLRWPEATVVIGAVDINQPVLNIWLDEAGELNLTQLLAAGDAQSAPDDQVAPPDDADDSPGAAWDVRIDAVRINGMQTAFTDRGLETPGALALNNIDLALTAVSNRPDSRIPLTLTADLLSGGNLQVGGDIAVLPVVDASLEFAVSGAQLTALQPWVENLAHVSVDTGSLSLDGTLSSTATEALALDVDIQLDELQVSDTRINEPLLGWQQLQLQNMQLSLAGNMLELSRIRLDQPFARLLIDANGGTNFGALVKPGKAPSADEGDTVEATTNAADGSTPLVVKIGATEVSDGQVNFTDLALPLPFSVLISEFGGQVSAFASNSRQPSKLDFNGKVGDYGLSTITGDVNLLDPTAKADITAEFRNVSMPEVSPYTIEFVGQKIKAGKLDLDLQYRFDDRLVRGDNRIVLRQFQLGEKVDNPEAMNLPLGLAVGLLRDVNGVINMNLNVSGDLDDPAFSARGLIMTAFANLITKAVAAPFKLLGSLVPGLGEENASQILFAPGQATLSPPEREKLALIATALEQRPALLLDVPTGTVEALDVKGLQAQEAEALITAEVGSSDDSEQLLRRRRRAVEKLASSQNALGEQSLRDVQAQYTPADTGTLDEVAYIQALQERIAATLIVDTARLSELAQARRDAVLKELIRQDLASDRLRSVDNARAVSATDGKVAIELGLETG